jgi:hypothetical protein
MTVRILEKAYSANGQCQLLICGKVCGDTEIYDLDNQLIRVGQVHFVNEKVLWLYISMHNLPLVAVSDGR